MVKERLSQDKSFLMDFLGFFFVVLWIIDMFLTFQRNPHELLWLSYLMMILLGIGFLFRDSYLILICLNIIAIPYTIWTVDFLHYLIFHKGLLGIVDYFFIPGSIVEKFISLQHITMVPFALVGLYFLKIKRKDSWKWSVLLVAVIFVLTRLLTSAESNVNCVFKSCLYAQFPSQIYIYVWFVLTAIMIFLSDALISNLGFLKQK